MKHINITIFGKVQGVFFRASAKAVADQLGVKGFVKNKDDGSVYIEAEGDNFSINSFLDFCRVGPDKAEVTNLDQQEAEFKGFKNFEILRKP